MGGDNPFDLTQQSNFVACLTQLLKSLLQIAARAFA